MAHEIALFDDTYVTGSDLSAARFLAVALASDGQVDKAGAGADSIGILQDDALGTGAGLAVQVRCLGVSKAVSGAAVEEGARVTPDVNGKLVTATEGDYVLGWAKTPAGGADEFFTVMVLPAGAVAPA